MKLRYLLAAALASFVLGLVVHAPAASLYAWIAGDGGPLRLHGIDGGLLSGTADQLARGNQTIVSDLRWRLVPADLLLGRASYALASSGAPLLLDGVVGIGLGGAVHVRKTRASGELRALAGIAGLPFVPVNGDVGLELDALTLIDRWPRSARGRVQVLGLSWALGREPVVLGDFEAQIEDGTDGIVARVGTLEGVIEVRGTAQLAEDGSYDVDLQLRPTDAAPPMVANLLRSLGPADANGYHRLRRQGQARPDAAAAPDGTTPPAPSSDEQRPSFLLPG